MDVVALLAEGVDGEEEGGFAELVAMGAVLPVADGAHGEEDGEVGVALAEGVDEGLVAGDDVVDGEAEAVEVGGGEFVAVGDDGAGGEVFVDPGGAPRDDEEADGGEEAVGFREALVDGGEALFGSGGGE